MARSGLGALEGPVGGIAGTGTRVYELRQRLQVEGRVGVCAVQRRAGEQPVPFLVGQTTKCPQRVLVKRCQGNRRSPGPGDKETGGILLT